ncbi:hypothetical protein RF11_00836 [Thelohanellus kitauei]|uniref:Uncharacterized protein n=1 Tax=Thelohanellus kitauei TaxID=669202 RepID=A0A0C2MXL0_THEKT|nr:hypothetical protein RF11_00836 [Thelohanellus kitauei]
MLHAKNLKQLYELTENNSFSSPKWKSVYNMDLCFVSQTTTKRGLSLFSILNHFRKIHNLLIVVEIDLHLQITNSETKLRWNLSNTNKKTYTELMEKYSRYISNYVFSKETNYDSPMF